VQAGEGVRERERDVLRLAAADLACVRSGRIRVDDRSYAWRALPTLLAEAGDDSITVPVGLAQRGPADAERSSTPGRKFSTTMSHASTSRSSAATHLVPQVDATIACRR